MARHKGVFFIKKIRFTSTNFAVQSLLQSVKKCKKSAKKCKVDVQDCTFKATHMTALAAFFWMMYAVKYLWMEAWISM